ncbi:hypothetical protein AS888_20530 [Peribacillus simplex]|uniref:Uncharacterized protein n=1 Tax=Peribacillus simplex TaxID=1478 RepID=A0A120GPC7_9BACI|nr:hypothetical protein AS888_20530 [Peribacillus simplex]
MAAQSKKGKKVRTIKRLVLQTVRTGIIKELNIKKGALGLLSVCRQKGFGIKKFRTPFEIPLKF